MDPFDVTSEAREAKCEEAEDDEPLPSFEPDETFSPLARKPKCHADARFTVSEQNGQVQAWTFREAMHKAMMVNGKWAEIHTRSLNGDWLLVVRMYPLLMAHEC